MEVRDPGLVVPRHPAGSGHRGLDRILETQERAGRDPFGIVVHAAAFIARGDVDSNPDLAFYPLRKTTDITQTQ